MSIHLEKEITNLKKKILLLSAIVEESAWKAVRSLEERNTEMATAVIDGDVDIDSMEVEIEEDCLKVLALYQPVAIDLRFIVAVLKINNDLERIGDLAVNIAEQSLFLASQQKLPIQADFSNMAEKTRIMLKKSLDAFLNKDSALCREVCASDDEVDTINRMIFDVVSRELAKNPEQIGTFIHLLSVSRHLERMADHATNIAEDVIYMLEGVIIRHKTEDYRK